MLIASVVWAQYINVTDTQTATSPWQMPQQKDQETKQRIHLEHYKQEQESLQLTLKQRRHQYEKLFI